jgi:hypothetical protein
MVHGRLDILHSGEAWNEGYYVLVICYKIHGINFSEYQRGTLKTRIENVLKGIA